MTIGDIGILAEAIEKCLPEIAKKNGGEDIRHRLNVSITVSQRELDEINRELYEMVNHSIPEETLPSVGAVDLDIVGIEFTISSSSLEDLSR